MGVQLPLSAKYGLDSRGPTKRKEIKSYAKAYRLSLGEKTKKFPKPSFGSSLLSAGPGTNSVNGLAAAVPGPDALLTRDQQFRGST